MGTAKNSATFPAPAGTRKNYVCYQKVFILPSYPCKTSNLLLLFSPI